MYLTLVDLLLATSILQSLALAAFLLLPGAFRLVSNRLLAASVLAFAAGLGEFFLYSTGLALSYPNLAYLGTLVGLLQASRSEERRVGKECRSGWTRAEYRVQVII